VIRRGASTSLDGLLSASSTNSPLSRVDVAYRGKRHSIWLKLEMHNPTGSIKYRTALGLLSALHRERPLGRSEWLIESSSGNLGVALAEIAGEAGWRFLAVVDPKTPQTLRSRMLGAGAELAMVDTVDDCGGYLLSRLDTVRRLLRESPSLRWTDQYHSTAGSAVHQTSTVPELMRQTGGLVDAVFVAVSTGGTIAGISEGLRRFVPGLDVYAVDVVGSIAVDGAGHPHLLTGIGATRRSTLLRPSHYTRLYRVADVEAIAMCRLFRHGTGLGLGASSGAVLAGLVRALADGVAPARPVLISPDGEDSYLATVYADDWLASRGVLPSVEAAEARARNDGLTFTPH
jgi:cysteine synthase